MTRTRQRKLFDENTLPWEEEESGLYAQVVFDRPMREIYTYAVPDDLSEQVLAGKRVLAPFGKGNHRTRGFCVGLTDQRPSIHRIKPIKAVVDENSLLSTTMLELTRWISDYYYCSWGQVLEAVLPRAVKDRKGTRWALFVTLVSEAARPQVSLTAKQQRVLETLLELDRPVRMQEVCQAVRCGPDCVKALVSKGIATTDRRRVYSRPPQPQPVVWDRPPELNPDQQKALDAIIVGIDAGRAQTYLMHGVTGSGKTEVYLRAIEQVVGQQREAIVLVPEIALTPQTLQRFRQRFDHVAVLHSHLTDADRHWYWQRIAAGQVQVVVGARSAIYAPCQNLGLIVIDEEHETTFKQESIPRYHAREVAIQRSCLERVPLILGSATPSLESWYATQSGRYQLLCLPHRVAGLEMPRVSLIDLREEYRRNRGQLRALSQPLEQAMRQILDTGGQVILLLNRRGFSATLLCPYCGHVQRCQHCDIALTYHKQLDRLLCHSCDAEFPLPERCGECGKPALRFIGFGTERLEEEVRFRFPDHACARMDSDSMRSADHYERVLGAFQQGKVKILLGTQMIAKGLDFPNVHLVGVINADTARHLPDFRASERTFQIVAQVAGRTGRGQTPGRVLVQTFEPDDPALGAACQHDSLGFIAGELPHRQEFGYPPYQHLMRVIVRSKDEQVANQAGRLFADRFRQVLRGDDRVRVLGPAPAPISKLRNYYRFHLQIHTTESRLRHKLLDQTLADLDLPGEAEYAIDIDPFDLL